MLLSGLVFFLCPVLAQDEGEEESGIKEDPNNIVGNFSFETIEGKLKRFGDIEVAVGWLSPTAAKADLYSKSAKKQELGVPRNIYGLCKPMDGDHIAGINMYSYNGKHPRSYLMTKLLSGMEAGQKYCIKFNVSLSDYSKYAVNNIGVFFSRKKLNIDEEVTITQKDYWTNTVNKIFDEQYTWQPVCNEYVATGDEKFMIIGNFAPDEETETKKMKRPKGFSNPQNTQAYYFIENISITPYDPDELCYCEIDDEEETPSIVYSKKHPNFDELSPEEKVQASTVYFADQKSELEDASKEDLEVVAKILAENSGISITAIGHTDASEEEEATANPSLFDLAGKRVMHVKQFLVAKGANPRQITVTNVKDDEPVDVSGSDIGMAKNRRVQFKLK